MLCSILAIGGLLLWPADHSAAQQTDRLRVEGRVERGTPDGLPLPDSMLIELRVVDTANAASIETLTTFTDEAGNFVFENVPAVEGNDFYVLYTTYDGMRQNTQPLFADLMNFVVFLVYEVSDEPTGVEIINGSIQIDEFAQITAGGTNLVVVMQLDLVNRGDRIVYDLETQTSLVLELPVGAFGVDELTSERSPDLFHLQIEDGVIPIVRNTIPLIPGWPTHTIRLTYLLPYPGSAILDQPFPVKTSNLRVWIPAETVYIGGEEGENSEMLSLVQEDQSLSPERPLYDVYQQAYTLAPSESLKVTLQGEPPANSRRFGVVDGGDDASSIQQILTIVGFVILMLVGVVVWRALRSRQATLAQQTLDQDKP